ncbi:hypothetical protein [Terricaulis sp.]|uniref:hypothetical protein n=1 Tax=Terricaulis sp. TaxID=2768686 RepID=UPI0037845850
MTYEKILESILYDTPLVYSHLVLDHRDGERLPAPPPVKSSNEEYPRDRKKNRLSGVFCLSLREFEELSLATRARLLELAPEGTGWSANFRDMQQIDAEALSKAIFDAAAQLRASGDLTKHGVDITGAYIKGSLDLSNAHLPFSVRLTGCVIDGALRLGRASLTTLDLSGSAMRGIHGTFLQTSGSLRMRRLTSTGVIDLGGVKVADVFDASDILVFPWDDPHYREAFVGDRGIVNLSLATLSNEMRLIRARIYGGLTMKGARIERSMFLDDAILRAPLAYLERVGADVAMADELFPKLKLAVRTAARAEKKLAKEVHGNYKQPGLSEAKWRRRRTRCRFDALEKLDLSQPLRAMGRDRLMRRLMAESVRARTSCLRADGLVINGSVFARSIRSSGRLRLKYAKIGGSLHLDGARMRSAKDIDEGLSNVLTTLQEGGASPISQEYAKRLSHLLAVTRKHAEKMESTENDDYALDMREIQVTGHVHLVPDTRRGVPHDLDDELKKVVTDFLEPLNLPPDVLEDWAPGSKKEPHKHAVYTNGQIAMEGAVINGDFELNGILANLHNVEPRPRPLVHKAKESFLLMEQAAIRGEMDVRGAIGIHGISAQHLVVASRIRFARHSVRENTNKNRAIGTSGKLQFSDSRIGGDAVFLFHKEEGPSLLLGRSHIEGRLHILPTKSLKIEGDGERDLHDFRRRDLGERINEDALKLMPEIDLRSARAAEFGNSEPAWPLADRLQAEGFTYEQTNAYGPLAPRARVAPGAQDWREYHFWVQFGGLAVFAAAILVFVFAMWGRAIDFHFGWFNVLAFLLVLLVVGAQFIIARASEPTRAASRPRAIFWLGLQKTALSVDKMLFRTLPMQPYSHAGKVLRSSGQIIAANTVEVDRLRRRHEQLSWRNNWHSRILLGLADRVTKYGFDPMRTVAAAIVCAAAFACAFHAADRDGYVRPIAGDLMSVLAEHEAAVGDGARLAEGNPAPPERDGEARVFASATPRADGSRPASRVTAYPAFSSLTFALDVMVPGLDLGQEEYWRPMASPIPGYPRSWWWWLFVGSAPVLKVIGWLLTTAIAISIITRVEAMISRHEE